METSINIVFICGGTPDADGPRLGALLSGSTQISKVIALEDHQPLETDAVRRLDASGLPWLTLKGSRDTGAVNRALLLCENDVIIAPPGITTFPGCIRELVSVAQLHDRIGAVVPIPMPGQLNPEDESFLHQANLPPAVEIPAPDIGLVYLRAPVLRMIGGLDSNFSNFPEALADWSMRAQRLGFVTLRALRALAAVSSIETVGLPKSSALSERHAIYDFQRQRAQADVTERMAFRALARKNSGPHVCLDLRYLPEDAINGTSVYALELCRALLKHTPVQISLLVDTDRQKQSLACLEVPVYLEGQQVPAIDLIHRPAQVFRERHLPWLLATPAPLVITFQDLIAYRAGAVFGNGMMHEMYQLVSHLAVRSAQSLIAISEHNRAELLREFYLPEGLVHVVHHGVNFHDFSHRHEDDNQRQLHACSVPNRFFFYAGADWTHKNIRLLLAAYARFRSMWNGSGAIPDLVMVGHHSGTVDGIYPTLGEQSPAGVRYLGDVSNALLLALYQESIALMFISAYEGFGLPILEAMAAGTPVICSRFTSIPEVAGEAGCYVDDLNDEAIARQMLELAYRPELRQKHITLGTARAAKFTWQETARKTYAAYEHALKAPCPRSLHERRVAKALCERLFPSNQP